MQQFFILCLMFLTPSAFAQLTVNVNNVPNSNGNILIGIYADSASFPIQNKTFKNLVVKAVGGKTIIRFNKLPKGFYALALYHDANGNQKLDTNILGVPTEYYGFSNNARGVFSAPSFADAKFFYNGKKATIKLTIK